MKRVLNKILNKYGYYNAITFNYISPIKANKVWSSTINLCSFGNNLTIRDNEVNRTTTKDLEEQQIIYNQIYKK